MWKQQMTIAQARAARGKGLVVVAPAVTAAAAGAAGKHLWRLLPSQHHLLPPAHLLLLIQSQPPHQASPRNRGLQQSPALWMHPASRSAPWLCHGFFALLPPPLLLLLDLTDFTGRARVGVGGGEGRNNNNNTILWCFSRAPDCGTMSEYIYTMTHTHTHTTLTF